MRDVARAADVALGTVTYHFDGIDEVLAGVLAEEMVAFSAPVTSAARDGGHRARRPRRRHRRPRRAPTTGPRQHWRLWLDFWALASHVPRYGEWQSEIYRDLHGADRRAARARGPQDGTLTVVDPARQAIEFVALLDGLVVQCYLPHPRLPVGPGAGDPAGVRAPQPTAWRSPALAERRLGGRRQLLPAAEPPACGPVPPRGPDRPRRRAVSARMGTGLVGHMSEGEHACGCPRKSSPASV